MDDDVDRWDLWLSEGVVRSTAQHDLITVLPFTFTAAEGGDRVVSRNCLRNLSKTDGIRKLPLASSMRGCGYGVWRRKEAVALCAREQGNKFARSFRFH